MEINTPVTHKMLNRQGYNLHYYTSGDKNKEAINK